MKTLSLPIDLMCRRNELKKIDENYNEDTIASVVDSYDYSNTDNLPKVFLYTGGANQMEKDTIPYVDLVYNKMSENGYPENKLNTLTDTTKNHNEEAWSEYFPQAFKRLVGFAA